MTSNKPKPAGMKQLSPGIYVAGNPPHARLELDVPELLQHLGLADTEENRDALIELGETTAREAGILCQEAKVGHNHKHLCPGHGALWLHEGQRKKCKTPRKAFCSACKS